VRAKSVVGYSRSSRSRSSAEKRPRSKIQDATKRLRHFGIVDLDVRAGFLPNVLDRISARQSSFRFELIVATFPTGLTRAGPRVRPILEQLGVQISDEDLEANVYAPDIFRAAKSLKRDMGFKALGVTVSKKILDLEALDSAGEKVEWDLFSTSSDGIAIASAYELREYARKAKREFEACLASMLVAALFVEYFPKVEFHKDTRRCIFDRCDDRSEIVRGLKEMKISKEVLKSFPLGVRSDVERVIAAIRNYVRS
jgi:hypothetical protein